MDGVWMCYGCASRTKPDGRGRMHDLLPNHGLLSFTTCLYQEVQKLRWGECDGMNPLYVARNCQHIVIKFLFNGRSVLLLFSTILWNNSDICAVLQLVIALMCGKYMFATYFLRNVQEWAISDTHSGSAWARVNA